MISVNIYSIFFVCVFIEIYGYYEHRNKIFRCNDGEYIENDLFCSGEMVCNDKSDESYGCDKDCGQSRFKCKEGPCLNILVRCNTIKDCPDGSDELNCGDEVNVRNCSSKDGKFLCHDGRRCIGLEYTCDDYCNCFDCSDENSNCSKSDPSLVAKCPNSYFSTATGPTCLCGPNSSTNTSCNELKDCDDHTCDHRCFQFKHRKQCSCYENFHELPGTNGMKCRSNTWYGGSVIYSTQLRIKSMNLTTNRTQLVRNGVNCTALGGAHDYIVYATQLQNNAKIFKTSITSKQTDLVTASDSLVISISVDYITRNIYFTTNTSLSVCSNDGRICTQMKCCSVKHVAVAPELGLMFYTQKINSQEEQYIMKANMDGTEESVLVDGVYSSIVTMAVDELIETLYWFDSGFKDKVEFISFDGEHKETWYTYFETKRHVFSLTVLENALLFTKKQENEIFIFRDLDIKEAEYSSYFHDNSSDVLKYLHAYNPQLQRTNEAMNPCSATSCKGLCLLRPASPTKGTRLSYTCLCDNFTATDGNHWCKSQNTSTSLHGIFAAENTPEISAKELNSCEFQLSKEHVLFVVSVIALVIIILALGSYFLIFRRYNWVSYYEIMQKWRRRKSDEVDMSANISS